MEKHRKILLLLVCIIALAIFFRLFRITELPPGLYPDEAMNGNNALEAIETGNYKVFYPENNGREGLFINLQALLLKVLVPIIGSPEPWMLRILSALFGILTVLGVYFLSKELFRRKSTNSESYTNLPAQLAFGNSKAGGRISLFEKYSLFADGIALFASFFTAISFWHVNFSRIGFRAIMAPFFFTWALYLLLKALRSKSPHPTSYILYSILGGLFLGGGLYSYIAYRVVPLIILVVLFLFIKELGVKKVFKISLAVFVGALITASPLLIYFLNNPQDFFGRTTQISVFAGSHPIRDIALNTVKTIFMFNGTGDYNWRHNISAAPLLSWPVGLFFLIGIFYGIYQIFKKSKSENWNLFKGFGLGFGILFAWFLVALLPIVISNEGIPHSLRAILLVPPVMILSGFGAFLFFDLALSKLNRKIYYFILALFVLTLTIQSYKDYFIKWGKNSEVQGAFSADYVKIGKEINSLPKETPKYVVVGAGGTDVRGIPMPAQTTMFITDSFREGGRKNKNIRYISKEEASSIPEEGSVFFIK